MISTSISDFGKKQNPKTTMHHVIMLMQLFHIIPELESKPGVALKRICQKNMHRSLAKIS